MRLVGLFAKYAGTGQLEGTTVMNRESRERREPREQGNGWNGLTLARTCVLSPGERMLPCTLSIVRLSVRPIPARRISKPRRVFLLLLWGEGRGEGGRQTFCDPKPVRADMVVAVSFPNQPSSVGAASFADAAPTELGIIAGRVSTDIPRRWR